MRTVLFGLVVAMLTAVAAAGQEAPTTIALEQLITKKLIRMEAERKRSVPALWVLARGANRD